MNFFFRKVPSLEIFEKTKKTLTDRSNEERGQVDCLLLRARVQQSLDCFRSCVTSAEIATVL